MKILDKKSYFKLIVNDSILLICAFLIFTNLPRKDLDYDLNTEIGQLQQEILDKYNVATYYNYDINHDVTSIFFGLSHNKDKNITEKEALNSLKKIDKVLSLYSGNYPRCVYLVNDLKVKNENVGGLFINIRNIIVLNNYFSLTNDFHHEMGHCIEDKTFDIKTLYRFKEADESCNMISSYACTSGDEMFAETWAYAIYDGATTPQSLCLSNVFKKNIKLFENPNYVEFKDNKENLSDLFNNKIDNVVIKKKDGITLSKILINNPVANRLNRLELEDEIAFYNIRWN